MFSKETIEMINFRFGGYSRKETGEYGSGKWHLYFHAENGNDFEEDEITMIPQDGVVEITQIDEGYPVITFIPYENITDIYVLDDREE